MLRNQPRSSRSSRGILVGGGALVALAIAACNSSSSTPAPTKPVESAATAPSASVSSAAVEPTASATATAAVTAEPTPTATAVASAIVDAGAPKSASTKPSKDKDAGAPDAGSKLATATDGGAPVASSAPLPTPAPGSADEVAAKVDAIYVPKKTFTAKFKQEYTAKVSGTVKNSTGTVFVEKPNKISFRYDAPNKNRIVSDGTTLKIYVAEDSQMIQQPVAKTEYPGALSFLMGHGVRESFDFKFNEKVKFEAGPVLYGKPKSETPFYEYVQFYVDKAMLDKGDAGAMSQVLIVDAQGNKNRFTFESGSVPATIDATEFQFTPPAGTDIKQNP